MLSIPKSRATRALTYCLGGLSIVAVFFFGTLTLLNTRDARMRDALRAEHAGMLMRALDRYKATRGKYPGPFPDNPAEDLAPQLVGGGYLSAIPRDPLPGNTYRYTTAGATGDQRYGLKVTLERGGNCITGVGTQGSGWWPALPKCPF